MFTRSTMHACAFIPFNTPPTQHGTNSFLQKYVIGTPAKIKACTYSVNIVIIAFVNVYVTLYRNQPNI